MSIFAVQLFHILLVFTSMRCEVRIDKSGQITGNGLDSTSDGAGAHLNGFVLLGCTIT